METLKPFCVCG